PGPSCTTGMRTVWIGVYSRCFRIVFILSRTGARYADNRSPPNGTMNARAWRNVPAAKNENTLQAFRQFLRGLRRGKTKSRRATPPRAGAEYLRKQRAGD